MKKNRKVSILICLIILEFLAATYDVVFNDSRLIKPIVIETYKFHFSDLPMIIITTALVFYVMYLAVRIFIIGFKKNHNIETKVTRKLNPRYGWFGFFGFLGFMGIPSYMMQQQVWPFFFFIFFGFFGFFYEAKLSSTLIDERFKEEQSRAQLVSYKTGFGLLWMVTWFTGFMGNRLSMNSVAIIFTISSSLIIALVLFLSNYLLYKYDTEEVV